MQKSVEVSKLSELGEDVGVSLPKPFGVLIADDHELLSQSLANALSSYDMHAITAKSFHEVLVALRKSDSLDMVLLDLKMPGMQGLESVKAIVNAAGKTKVVLFTGSIEPDFLKAAMAHHVWGLIPKTISLRSMIGVINLIATGETFLPSSGSTSVIKSTDEADFGALNKNEFSVLKHAAEGLTNKEIAFQLGTSESRVKMLMRTACGKIGARNRAHAAVLCREMGVL